MDTLAQNVTMDTLVQTRIALGDYVKKEQEALTERLAPYVEKIALLDVAMLSRLNEMHADSVKTEFGTCYKSTTMSATVDSENDGWTRLLDHILTRGLERAAAALESGGSLKDATIAFRAIPDLGLLVRNVVKTAVQEYMDNHAGQLPPGVKTAQITKLNVRRA